MARKTGSHSDITGPRVRKAALHLIAAHGYAAVSMRRIAAEVGVQAGALYNYTPDKQSLLFDLLEAHMTELLEALAATPMPADPAARLDAFTRFHIRFHLPRAERVFVSYMELRNLTEPNFAEITGMRRRYEDALQDILEDGVASGLFAIRDTRMTTLAVIAMLTGIVNWYRPGGRLSPEEIEATYLTLVRRTAGAGPETAREADAGAAPPAPRVSA